LRTAGACSTILSIERREPMPAKPSDPDAYLTKLSPDKRATLAKVRAAIRAAAPDAHEGMSYGMPAFILGKPIAGYSASANHCSYFPMSGAITTALAADLKGYATSKGGIRFPIGKPPPATLIRKLVKARLAEIDGSAGKKSARKQADVAAVLRELQRNASKRYRADMSARYGIVTRAIVYGTPVAKLKLIARKLGRDHELAGALWNSGVHDARMLAAMVDDPARVTPAQMNRWAKDFDNWGIVDTVCFHLFDRTAHAFGRVEAWAKAKDEFVKRAAFALLASAALHGHGDEADHLRGLALIERAASDPRNFVKKGVSWALRAIGGKSSRKLRAAARDLARRLAASADAAQRQIGKDAIRAFEGAGK
jgi:3-methyladenine DNA glycosylase AlkD